jgi:hypothetical protein
MSIFEGQEQTMNNLAMKIDPNRVFQEGGAVLRLEGSCILVATTSGTYRAKRAVSCLVAPEPGDRVLVAALEDGTVYVLAILEREDGQVTTISVEGDLTLRLPSGRFDVAAQEGMNLISGKDMAIVTGGLDVSAVRGGFAVEHLSFLGTFLQANIEKAKLFAGSLDSRLDRLSQRVKRSYRFVDEIDQVRAEQIDYAAKKSLSLHARNALVTAEELVKLDGEQIHVG